MKMITRLTQNQLYRLIVWVAALIWSLLISTLALMGSAHQLSWTLCLVAIVIVIMAAQLGSPVFAPHRARWIYAVGFLTYAALSYGILRGTPPEDQKIWCLITLLPLWQQIFRKDAAISLKPDSRKIRGLLMVTVPGILLVSATLLVRITFQETFATLGTGISYWLFLPTWTHSVVQTQTQTKHRPSTLTSTLPSLFLVTMTLGIVLRFPFVSGTLSGMAIPLLLTGPIFFPWMGLSGHSRGAAYFTIGITGLAVTLHTVINPVILIGILIGALLSLMMWWGPYVSYTDYPQVRGIALLGVAMALSVLAYHFAGFFNPEAFSPVILSVLFIAILTLPKTVPLVPSQSVQSKGEAGDTEPGSLLIPSRMIADQPSQQTILAEQWLFRCGLTPQEKKITQLLLDGYSNKEITSELYISINTLKTHLRNIYRKTDTANRRELISRYKRGDHTRPSAATS